MGRQHGCSVTAASTGLKCGGAGDFWTRGECCCVFIFSEKKHIVRKVHNKSFMYSGVCCETYLHQVITFICLSTYTLCEFRL